MKPAAVAVPLMRCEAFQCGSGCLVAHFTTEPDGMVVDCDRDPMAGFGGRGAARMAVAGKAPGMDPAELKKLLIKSKKGPVNCAVATDKEGAALVSPPWRAYRLPTTDADIRGVGRQAPWGRRSGSTPRRWVGIPTIRLPHIAGGERSFGVQNDRGVST